MSNGPVIETLAELVKINSVNPEWNGPGEKAVADWVRNFFETRGIETREEEVLPGRPNVIAMIPGKDRSRRIIFEAHMDTVSAHEMDIPPFEPEIKDGKLFGRGSVDVKSALAAMMHAVASFKENGSIPRCDVWLAAVVDEEHHYRGVLKLIETLHEPEHLDTITEAAVIAEPTNCRVVRANKGVLRWCLTTHGKAAHSSKPHLGSNAISQMAKVIPVIEATARKIGKSNHELVGPPTCSIGLIEGGTQINFVPEQCTIALDNRLIPGETGESVLNIYREAIAELQKNNPEIQVTIEEPSLVDEAMETPETAPVVKDSCRILSEMGFSDDAVPIGVPFGCDATKLSRDGIDSIIFGPGSIDQAHGAIEYVEIEQVLRAEEFYRRLLEDSERK